LFCFGDKVANRENMTVGINRNAVSGARGAEDRCGIGLGRNLHMELKQCVEALIQIKIELLGVGAPRFGK